MSTRDLLLELLCEELPPRTLPALSEALRSAIEKGLDTAVLAHGRVEGFATPRRLAVRVAKLAETQPDREVERRGPPLKAAFDAQGAPTQAATAFAKNCGVALAKLDQLSTEKGAWLVFRGTEHGASTISLLGGIVSQAIAALPIARRMRWGAHTAEFVRPVHGVVLLFGEDVVPLEILGVETGRITRGHRFHAPSVIELRNPKSYVSRLRRAKVIVDFGTRREKIRAAVSAAAVACGGRALIDAPLLDEVSALVEWPVAVAGQFEQRFLSLPPEVVIATVKDHQRYFPVAAADGGLSGWFITVSNIDSKDPAKVREGNERVVRPRLSDAAFFWEQDRKIPLAAHAAKLSQVIFQTKLGSYADKTRRVRILAQSIARRIGGEYAAEAAELAKADLMTAMVGEFPELQGTMGRYYALADGLNPELAYAIEEHYRPRFAGDALPTSRSAQALALADKIDTLVGIFSIDERPTGAKDPFGLRRAALGVLRILLEGEIELDLIELLQESSSAQPVIKPTVVGEVYAFISERLRGLLEESGASAEQLDAVLANRPASPLDARTRLQALQTFLTLPEAPVLCALNKRIANILRKAPLDADARVEEEALGEAAERRLHGMLKSLAPTVLSAAGAHRYTEALSALIALRAPVDEFFEQVMVMDEDPRRRRNRLALLRDLQRLLGGIVDLSRLPG